MPSWKPKTQPNGAVHGFFRQMEHLKLPKTNWLAFHSSKSEDFQILTVWCSTQSVSWRQFQKIIFRVESEIVIKYKRIKWAPSRKASHFLPRVITFSQVQYLYWNLSLYYLILSKNVLYFIGIKYITIVKSIREYSEMSQYQRACHWIPPFVDLQYY